MYMDSLPQCLIQGLRVADASVFPNITSGNTQASIIVIAEKAADLIRDIDSVKTYRKQIRGIR